ncbi:9473_t:CDS:1, partial [Ambispora leptoticha]
KMLNESDHDGYNKYDRDYYYDKRYKKKISLIISSIIFLIIT